MKRAEFALMSKSVVHYNAVPGTNTIVAHLVFFLPDQVNLFWPPPPLPNPGRRRRTNCS